MRNPIKSRLNTKAHLSEQAKLLRYIFDKKGGIVQVARILGMSKQRISIWTKRGFVPLKELMSVSVHLEVDPLYLNYSQYSKLIGAKKTWEDIKSSCYSQF